MATSIIDIERDPDEWADLRSLIAEVVPDPEAWLDRPNERLGGARPRDLLDTDRETFVRDLARSIKVGTFS